VLVTGDVVDVNTIGTYVVRFNIADAAGNDALEVTQTVNITAAPALAPQDVPVIGTITVDETTASIPFTYPDSDATGFQSSLNGEPYVAATSPINLTGLPSGTAGTMAVRAINGIGAGTPSAAEPFTTDTAVVVLRGVRGDAVPSTGWHGFPSIIYPFIDPVAEAADKFYAVIVGPVPAGLTLNDDGSFEGSGLAVGFHRFNFQIYKNEVAYGPVRINEAECKAA
jgi:hypothetical protein